MSDNNGADVENKGPPAGSSSDTRQGPQIPFDTLAQQSKVIRGGDPAFSNPTDPLKGVKPGQVAGIVYRDVPLVVIQNAWSVEQVRQALAGHMAGQFEGSGQLVDAILGDPRIQSTLGSRTAGLFGRDVRFEPANDSREAKDVLDAWVEHWPNLFNASFPELHSWGIFQGFAPGQLLWDTAGPNWLPYIRPWHTRFTYFDWQSRKFIAITQDAGIPITPGNGKWILHAPYGEYRGWVRGAVRAVAEPWLLRHFAIRDWGGWSEQYGSPIKKGKVPASCEPAERKQFEIALGQLGANTTLLVQQGVEPGLGYDLELLETKSTGWDGFAGLRDHCDMDITLALLFQNLTTEVTGGSFAATSSHMDIRQSGIEWDHAAWCGTKGGGGTIRNQIARPFAYLNAGDANLAPKTFFDITPRDDYKNNADQFGKIGAAFEVLRRGGIQFNDPGAIQRWIKSSFGLGNLPDFEIVEPAQPGAPAPSSPDKEDK